MAPSARGPMPSDPSGPESAQLGKVRRLAALCVIGSALIALNLGAWIIYLASRDTPTVVTGTTTPDVPRPTQNSPAAPASPIQNPQSKIPNPVPPPLKLETGSVPWDTPKPPPVGQVSNLPPSAPPSLKPPLILPKVDIATATDPFAKPSAPSPGTPGEGRGEGQSKIPNPNSKIDLPRVDLETAANPFDPAAAPAKPKPRLIHANLPADPVQYAKAIDNFPKPLLDWLAEWKTATDASQPIAPAMIDRLSANLKSEISNPKLSFDALFDLGQRLETQTPEKAEGQKLAAAFYRLAVPLAEARCQSELANPKSEIPKHVLDMLWTMQWCLGGVNDWDAAQANALVLQKYVPRGGRDEYLARLQYAEGFYIKGRRDRNLTAEAVVLIKGIVDDQGLKLDTADRATLWWALGSSYWQATDYPHCAGYLEKLVDSGQSFNPFAWRLLVESLARAGRFDDARRRLKQWQDSPNPPHKFVAKSFEGIISDLEQRQREKKSENPPTTQGKERP